VRRPAPQASVGPSFLDVKSASRTLVDADQSTEIVGYVLALAMAPAPVSAVWMFHALWFRLRRCCGEHLVSSEPADHPLSVTAESPQVDT
jgi:hypothetical protein